MHVQLREFQGYDMLRLEFHSKDSSAQRQTTLVSTQYTQLQSWMDVSLNELLSEFLIFAALTAMSPEGGTDSSLKGDSSSKVESVPASRFKELTVGERDEKHTLLCRRVFWDEQAQESCILAGQRLRW
jgi:hypothetical protein